jgi:hypothetical protein
MTYDLRWFLVFMSNLLLIFLVAEVNHYLAPLALQVYLGGLFLTFGILRLQLRHGLIATALTGLVLDAVNPRPFGYTFFLMVGCHVAVFSMRGHFARETFRSCLLVALALNLVLFVGIGIAAGRGNPAPSLFWGRIVADSAFSMLAVLIVAPWFFALQKCALASIGIDLDAEQREAQ